MPRTTLIHVVSVIAMFVASGPASAADPWVVTTPVALTLPTELGDVVVVSGGVLHISGVAAPGVRLAGNLLAVGTGRVVIEDSVVRIESVFHGQYAVVASDDASLEISGCDYRVTRGVQHGLISAGNAVVDVRDTDFGDVQLIAAETSRFTAERLNGNFEVIVEHDASMELADIPRTADSGELWVWVQFPPGSTAVYTPPMPGFVDTWSFPPPGATGILQRVEMRRCQAKLWPMLVRQGTDLVLRDIPEDNWVVVGLHLPDDAVVEGLLNGAMPDGRVNIDDRRLVLDHASVDTWNLYPEDDARVLVRRSLVGEILTMGGAHARVEDTTVDGSGGFLGARDHSGLELRRSTVTCTVEATQDATLEFVDSEVQPYPFDTAGAFTRIGAYDRARLLAANTTIATNPALAGQGLFGGIFLAGLPAAPPPPGDSATLYGVAALFALDGGPVPGRWRLDALARRDGLAQIIAEGDGNVEEATFGTWRGADPTQDYLLRLTLLDAWGRPFVYGVPVPRAGVGWRTPLRRAAPDPSAAAARVWRQGDARRAAQGKPGGRARVPPR